MAQQPDGEPTSSLGIPSPASKENLPRQFGKYTLLRRLASGGMAEIFLALQRSAGGFEKLIVIKRILPSMNQDRAFIDMLLHEARVAASMSHPNIVQTFDVGQVDGTHFIAMEHIHGEDIRSIIRAMRKKNLSEFPLEHSIAITIGMCAGLAYAHERRDFEGRSLNIVHRDISPQNIVVTFSGDVKIVDFGVAKSSQQSGDDTKDGQLKGKVPYMSPEQAAGGNIDWRSDIFAVGVLLFELSTGKRLFKGASEFETLKLICDKDYPRPSAVKPGFPPALDRIIMKALEKDRDRRYQSAREMQSDLETFVREERIAVSQISLTQWMYSLFEEKLAQHKEVLQDVKQLADLIAVQQGSSFEGATSAGTMSATGGTRHAPRRSSTGLWLALVAVTGVAVSGFFYMRKQAAEREAAALRSRPATTEVKPAPPPPPEIKGSIEVKCGGDEGCAIWISGDLRKEVTPATIGGLPLDTDIQVKLTHEGFETYRETVKLTEAAPNRTISAVMKAGTVTLVLKVIPLPSIWLDDKPIKGNPPSIEGLSADEEHKLVLQANGHVPKIIKFTAKNGETKTIQEVLTKLDSDGKSGDPATVDASKMGKVRVTSKNGFCNVTINGTVYGSTPVEADVKEGTARITCKPDGTGPAQSQSVQVKAGEVSRAAFKL